MEEVEGLIEGDRRGEEEVTLERRKRKKERAKERERERVRKEYIRSQKWYTRRQKMSIPDVRKWVYQTTKK